MTWRKFEILNFSHPVKHLPGAGIVDGGSCFGLVAFLLCCLLDLFSKPVFRFIRFGHLKIQMQCLSSALRASLVELLTPRRLGLETGGAGAGNAVQVVGLVLAGQ